MTVFVFLGSLLATLLPFALIILLFIFLMNQAQGGGGHGCHPLGLGVGEIVCDGQAVDRGDHDAVQFGNRAMHGRDDALQFHGFAGLVLRYRHGKEAPRFVK